MENDPVEVQAVDPMEGIEVEGEQADTRQRLCTKPFLNVMVSAVVMCLVFSAFFSGGGLLDVVVTDASLPNGADVGFTSQGILSIAGIFTALLSPIVINATGLRASLGIATFLYCGLYIGIIFLQTWTIYLGSVITGMGMGMIWVVTLKILTDNSTEENLQRNNSIWWCIFMLSMVIGNTAEYFYLGHLTSIGSKTRLYIYLICCVVVIVAVLVGVFGYRNLMEDVGNDTEEFRSLISMSNDMRERMEVSEHGSTWQRMTRTLGRYRITLLRKEVAFVFTLFIYNAVILSFYTLTYQTCIGNTFTDRNLIPLMSLVLGVTEVIASPVFELATAKLGNRVLVIFLYVIALASFYLTFLMFPPAASYRSVLDVRTYVQPQKSLVLLIAVLLGISDAGFNIIQNSTLGFLFQSESEIGFMLLNAIMSLTTAITFFISPYISLYALLATEAVLCTFATICVSMDVFKTGQ